jgi:hypothetical protein
MTMETQTEQRRITADHLARWFPDDETYQAKTSYAQRLKEAGLTDSELEQITSLYQRKLQDQVVTWQNSVGFVRSIKE